MEEVVLVDEQNRELGTALKDIIHTKNTPLHRGFSLFLFNSKGQALLTKRSKHKKTFPGLWTNTVCGHPGPGERVIDAALRRLNYELGIMNYGDIKEIAQYRYRFVDKNGIVENEICPILVAHSDANPTPDPAEVEEWKWMKWGEFLKDIQKHSDQYSPWSIEEASLLTKKFTH